MRFNQSIMQNLTELILLKTWYTCHAHTMPLIEKV